MNLILSYLQNNLDIVFFIYGFAFVIMGIAILVQPKKGSAFKLANVLWLLAMFGLTHGTNEFLDMWAIIKGRNPSLDIVRWFILVISFFFLFEFGRQIFCLQESQCSGWQKKLSEKLSWWLSPVIGLFILALGLSSPDFWKTGSTMARYFLAFPGCLLIYIGLNTYYKSEEKMLKPLKVEKFFITAGLSFLVYGILGGLVVPKGNFFLADILNTDTFLETIKIPVQVFRAVCAVFSAWAAINILQIFNWEMTGKIEEKTEALEKTYEELKRIDEDKTNFMSMVSHEIRTPLASIKAFAEILLHNPGEDLKTQTDFLGIINTESDRLTRLINDVLDLAKIEAGKVEWHMENLDISQVIKSSASTVKVITDEKGQEISIDIELALPQILGDRDRLVQVMTNLVKNACEYTEEKGKIIIQAKKAKNFLEISVTDTGRGLAPEDIEKVFEKFVRVKEGESKKTKGTGLGLTICKEIVEYHGGKIWVESEGVGRGSTFRFTIPIEPH